MDHSASSAEAATARTAPATPPTGVDLDLLAVLLAAIAALWFTGRWEQPAQLVRMGAWA